MHIQAWGIRSHQPDTAEQRYRRPEQVPLAANVIAMPGPQQGMSLLLEARKADDCEGDNGQGDDTGGDNDAVVDDDDDVDAVEVEDVVVVDDDGDAVGDDETDGADDGCDDAGAGDG